MKAQRIINGALIVGLVVSLLGGALTISKLLETARVNSDLVCILGKAASSPIKQREGESRAEFHRRVKIAREFVRLLRDELDDCDAKQPPAVTVDPDSKRRRSERPLPKRERKSEAGKQGGGRSSGSPGSQPGPPSGGPPGGPSPPGNPSPGPPTPSPPSPNPGQNPNPLRPALDNLTDTAQGTVDSTCETVNGLGVPLC